MDHKNDCSVCGKELVYLDEDENTECFYCKDPYTSNVRCEPVIMFVTGATALQAMTSSSSTA